MKQIILLAFMLINALLVVSEVPANGSPAFINDNNALQYALRLENLEAAFYNQALTNLTAAQLNAAGINGTILTYIQNIRDHENMHVAAIRATLIARGATPVDDCVYNFGINNATTFLKIAQALENTGVMAYDFAVVALTDTTLLTFAVTVATVEARHAAFLNTLNGASPFPNATDTAKSPTDILAIAGPFITSCPQQLTLPTSADLYRNLNGSEINQTIYNPYKNNSLPFLNDNVALNYALTLELLEAAFYNEGLAKYSQTNFTSSSNLTVTQFNNLLSIQAHENAHVAALQMVLSARGATPVSACNYTFPYNTTNSFLAVARILENTGVSAYAGAASTISDEGILMYAATIATVEARHASFLNEILGASPFPNATDTPLAPTTIGAAVTAFILGCPQSIVFPVPSDSFRRVNSTNGLTTASMTSANAGATSSPMTTAMSGDATTSTPGMTSSPMTTAMSGDMMTTAMSGDMMTTAMSGDMMMTTSQTQETSDASSIIVKSIFILFGTLSVFLL